MINKDKFEQGITNFHLGKNTDQFAAPEQSTGSEGVQVASKGGIGREVLKLFNKSSSKMVRNRPTRAKAHEVSLSQIEEQIKVMGGKEVKDSPINRNVIAQTMNQVEGEADLARLVETAATFETQTTPRTFKDIAGDMTSAKDALEELEPVLRGKQSGLLTDRQMFGVRSLMETASIKAEEMANLIIRGNASAENLLEYQNSLASYKVLKAYATGQASEIARALNQQKMVTRALSTDSLRMMDDAVESISGGGGPESIVRSAETLAAKAKGKGSLKAIDSMAEAFMNPVRVAVEYYKNNILSGWETHAVNLTSVAVANLWDNYSVRPVAAGVGAVRQLAAGGQPIDRVYSAEVAATIAGSTAGLRGSFSILARTLMTGESAFGAGKAEYGGAMHKFARDLGLGKPGELAADASSLSFRLLRAEDDVMRGLAFSQQLYALAARDAKLKGLSGEEMITHMNKLIDDPSPEMYDSAADFATKVTFTNTDNKGVVGVMAQSIRSLVGKVPPLQFLIPFVNTPANLLQYAFESSALATVSPKLWKEIQQGGASKDVAMAKMITGTALSVAFWQMYEADIITGGGPPGDYKGQEMMKREGWQPFAVHVGGKTYGLERMEPFSTSMAFVVGMFERAKFARTEEDAKKYFTNVILALSEPAFDSIWMKGINDFMKATESETMWENYMSNFATGWVPYSASLRSVKKVMDPIERRVSKDEFVNDLSFQSAQRIKGNLPILSEYVRPARYWDGEVIDPGVHGFAHAVSPVKMGNAAQGDVINRELFTNGIVPQEPSSVFNLGPARFSLLELDQSGRIYDMYIKHVGKGRRTVLEKIIKKPRYQQQDSGPNGFRWQVLQTGLSSGKMLGMKTFLDELEDVLEKNPAIGNRIATKFSMDPKRFIKQLYKEARASIPTDVKTKAKGVPVREKFEIPRMQ